MTVASLIMPTLRAEAPGKQSLRLPIIAPKDEVHSHARAPAGSRQSNSLSVPPRVRLPPRSRTGCWTCRSRKVKCDENRPFCGQCSRLGHACDYSPRLSFRDDTPRVMERMTDVSIVGNAVWDPSSRSGSLSPLPSPGLIDALPPFAILTTDEERERKAEASNPGTYHVVVNPDSFSSLPEYSDDFTDEASAPKMSSNRRGSATSSMISGQRHEREGSADRNDPNVVILDRFEDSSQRSLSNQWKKSGLSPSISSDMTNASSPSDPVPQIAQEFPFGYNLSRPLDRVVVPGGADEILLSHFRGVVWKQLMQGQSIRDVSTPLSSPILPSVEIFEEVAMTFRPLFHAMMAVSALSLAHHDGHRSIDALQHYQQAFPSLQTCLRRNEDLCSDGLFLTHFLLLIYEIAAAESGGSNLWCHHISRLHDLAFMRIQTFGRERFPYIIWWVCNIDLNALLSGAGRGEFLAAMMENNMLPGPESQLYPLAPNGYSIIYSDEHDSLPAVLRLHRETFVLAARLGFLASELRQGNGSMSPNSFAHASAKLYALRDHFKSLWESSSANYLVQHMDQFPQRSHELMQNSLTLYHACQLFAAISMWPGQRLTSESLTEDEIMHHVSGILQVAECIVNAGRLDLRFIVFPIFMAGVASSSGAQKMMAMDLLSNMERDGVGRNASTIRQLLQIVYERQTQQFMMMGHPLDVDWAGMMVEHGLQVVNFGL